MPSQRSILITGCSAGGAGSALALEFASHGFRVFATARTLRTLGHLEAKGIETLTLDVSKPESIEALKMEITKRTGGKLHMLFNNAGLMYQSPAIEAEPLKVRQMFDANVFGMFDMITSFIPLLLAAVPDSSTPPTIINTASIVARVPLPFTAQYNASKAAVVAYSDTLRLELAPLGIKVIALYMGQVSTPLISSDTAVFKTDTIYADVEEGARQSSRTHERESMKPEEFARRVVKGILSTPKLNAGNYLWEGTKAYMVWVLNAIGWMKIFDSAMLSSVGLDKADKRKAVYTKGQALVKQR